MPVARIVTKVANGSPALIQLSSQLYAAGYTVVIAENGGAADLVVEVDELSLPEALVEAARLARENDVDVYLAPGLLAGSDAAPDEVLRPQVARPAASESSVQSLSERREEAVAEPAAPDVHISVEQGGVLATTLEELGAALSDGRVGIRQTLSSVQERAAAAWADFQQRRDQIAQQRRLEREQREIEREERRRRHEAELQRRAEEHQRLLAERERQAAEQTHVLREQMARESAIRAERERAEREQMAREAARLAETARAEEEQRRPAMEAERQRAYREQEAQRAAAREAERIRARRVEEELQPMVYADAPPPPETLEPVAPVPITPPRATAKPRPRPVYPARRIPSSRERQWQHAAFIASIAALAAMLGFAIAANVSPSSPMPSSVIQNGAQQQVPFGPAKMNAAPAKAVPPRRAAAAPLKTAPAKPQVAKPVPPRRAQRASRESDVIAEDEVVIRHAPTSRAQRAQTQRGPTTAGVRRYSDEN